jgi:hypothetical protein
MEGNWGAGEQGGWVQKPQKASFSLVFFIFWGLVHGSGDLLTQRRKGIEHERGLFVVECGGIWWIIGGIFLFGGVGSGLGTAGYQKVPKGTEKVIGTGIGRFFSIRGALAFVGMVRGYLRIGRHLYLVVKVPLWGVLATFGYL